MSPARSGGWCSGGDLDEVQRPGGHGRPRCDRPRGTGAARQRGRAEGAQPGRVRPAVHGRPGADRWPRARSHPAAAAAVLGRHRQRHRHPRRRPGHPVRRRSQRRAQVRRRQRARPRLPAEDQRVDHRHHRQGRRGHHPHLRRGLPAGVHRHQLQRPVDRQGRGARHRTGHRQHQPADRRCGARRERPHQAERQRRQPARRQLLHRHREQPGPPEPDHRPQGSGAGWQRCHHRCAVQPDHGQRPAGRQLLRRARRLRLHRRHLRPELDDQRPGRHPVGRRPQRRGPRRQDLAGAEQGDHPGHHLERSAHRQRGTLRRDPQRRQLLGGCCRSGDLQLALRRWQHRDR